MEHFISFPETEELKRIKRLILDLVDPAVDTGAIDQLISLSLSPLDDGAAALFNSDPLIDYQPQRPLMNYEDGRLVGMHRSGIVLLHASDVGNQPFLHLHDAESDFRWSALLVDMIDIIERFGMKSTFFFAAVPSATSHTRPADMVVRTAGKCENQVFEADFWLTTSFADYIEFHTAELSISHTNAAVHVPIYPTGDRYLTGVAGVLGLTSSLSGLYFPLGGLGQAATEEVEAYSSTIEGNEELAQFTGKSEKDYGTNGPVREYTTAPKPELRVPTVDEIGRAAEQFLAGVSSPHASALEKTSNPQGLLCKMKHYQGFLPDEPGVGESPAFDVSAARSHQAGAAAEVSERLADDEGDSRSSAEEAADVTTDAQTAESPEGAAESVADPAEGSAVGENKADGADADAEATESGTGAGVADTFEPEEANITGPEAPTVNAVEVEGKTAAEAEAAIGFESDEDFSTVSGEAGNGSKDIALTDNAAESDVPAEAVDTRDRSGVAAEFGDIGVVGGESDPEAHGESDPTRGDASNLGDDHNSAPKRENQEEALQTDVEADSTGEFESTAGTEESETGEDGERETYAVGEADLDGEKNGLREQTEPCGHAGAEELAGAEEAVGVEGGAVKEIADTEDARAFAGVEGAQESIGTEGSQEFADVEGRCELSGIQEAQGLNGIESTGKSADNEPGEVLRPDEALEPLSALERIKAFLKNLPDAPDPSEQNEEPDEALGPAETLKSLSVSGYIDVAAIESSDWSAPKGHAQDFGKGGTPGEDIEGAGGDDTILDVASAGSRGQAVGFEAAAAETEANAGLLITESKAIESVMGNSAGQPSDADGAPAKGSVEHVSVVDGILAGSAIAGPPSGADSAENPEAWKRPDELEPPVSFGLVGSFKPAAFDSSDPFESSRVFEGSGILPAGGEGSSREFEGVPFTTDDGGQAIGCETDGSEEGFIPSGAQSGNVDVWPVRGWGEALGFGRESETVVSQEDVDASHSIVFTPRIFGAALPARDTPGHSALGRTQALVLKDSPETDALAEVANKKAEQEAPAETDGDVSAAGTDGDAPASGEMAPDDIRLTGKNPEFPDEDEPSGGVSNDAATSGIGLTGNGGTAPTISVLNKADPLGGAGADSVPPASLPASSMEQLPEPGQNQVKRRQGKHSA